MSCIYFIENTKTKSFKIGHTKNVQARIKQLQTGNENHIMLRKQIFCDTKIEKMIHRYFEEQKIKSEWFNISIIQVYEVCKVIKLALMFKSRKILEVSDNNIWLNNYFKNNVDKKMILLREILLMPDKVEKIDVKISDTIEEYSDNGLDSKQDKKPLVLETEKVTEEQPKLLREFNKQIETIHCCNIL